MRVLVSSGGKFHAFNLAEQLDRKGFLERFLTTYYSPKYPFLARFRKDFEKIDVQRMKTFLLPALLFEMTKRIPALGTVLSDYTISNWYDHWASQQLEPCDLLIAFATFALETLRAARKAGISSILERGSAHVITELELIEEEYQKWNVKSKPSKQEEIDRQLQEYAESDYIQVPSSYARQTFLDKGVPAQKLKMCLLGVNLERFKPIPKEDAVFRIIYVGWLNFRKGLPYLFEAFKRLKLKNAELWIIGRFSQELVPLLTQHEEHFTYMGPIQNVKLHQYYSQGSVFVLPSISDGFGLVIPQAMACGLPVIATSHTGAPDILEDGKEGFIVPIRDIEALMDKIRLLYESGDLQQQMGQAALKRAEKLLNWNDYGDQLVKIYEEILNEK